MSGHVKALPDFFKEHADLNLELITQDDVRAGCSDLVVNMKTAGNTLFPIVRATLLHNQVDWIGFTPLIQNRLFI